MFKNFKKNLSKYNLLIISFLIFISIPIIISVSILTTRKWFDIMSILSIFYICVPTLLIIYKMNSKGSMKKIINNFRVKTKEKENFTHSELEKMSALNINNNSIEVAKNKNKNQDVIFISAVLIFYGLLLLISSAPSLIIWSMQ